MNRQEKKEHFDARVEVVVMRTVRIGGKYRKKGTKMRLRRLVANALVRQGNCVFADTPTGIATMRDTKTPERELKGFPFATDIGESVEFNAADGKPRRGVVDSCMKNADGLFVRVYVEGEGEFVLKREGKSFVHVEMLHGADDEGDDSNDGADENSDTDEKPPAEPASNNGDSAENGDDANDDDDEGELARLGDKLLTVAEYEAMNFRLAQRHFKKVTGRSAGASMDSLRERHAEEVAKAGGA